MNNDHKKSEAMAGTRLLTYRDLERWLGLSEVSIRSLMRDDGLPYVRLGRSVRFRHADVEKWLESQKQAG